MRTRALVVTLLLTVACGDDGPNDGQKISVSRLTAELARIRHERDIPGMSAAVAVAGRVVWAAGFGWADMERQIPAAPDTVYHLASLTKPYAATIVLQLVEEGRLQLDAPVRQFGIDRGGGVQVRHLLAHTSGEPAGTTYRYDGEAFAELERVIERVSGESFEEQLQSRIVEPLGLTATGRQHPRLATGYARRWGRRFWPTGLAGPMTPIENPPYFGAAAGMVASAPEVAMFSAALDAGRLLGRPMLEEAWTPSIDGSDPSPYGLGWFVQRHGGRRVVWHYGHWFGSSSLIIKLPEERLTFVLLANSEGLSRRTKLGDTGDVMRSPAAGTFFDLVVPLFSSRR